MNFCTSCGTPAGDARFCGNCGTPLTTAQPGAAVRESVSPRAPQPAQGREVSQPGTAADPSPSSTPHASRTGGAAPGSWPATRGDLGDVFRSDPGPAVRAAAVLALVTLALIKPWEVTALGLWGGTESTSAAGNGWALMALLLVVVAAGVGFFADNVRSLGLPVEPRALQLVLVAPCAVIALIAMVRMLAEESVMGPSVALGLVAAVLVVQIGAPAAEAGAWRVAATVLLGAGALLTLWQLRGVVELGRIDGMLAVILFITVGWIPLLGIWLIMGLREHKPAEWAALVVFGAGLLAAMVLLSEGADPGLTLMLAGATTAVAPGVATLMQMSPDPADRWLHWAAGVMVLWMVGGAVMCLIGLLGAIRLADVGVGVGALVWIGLWGGVTAIAAGTARNKLVADPATGRKVAVIFAAVSVLIYLVSLAAVDADLTDPAVLLAGLTVPVVIVLMLAVPRSVNQRYGSLLPASGSGPVVD